MFYVNYDAVGNICPDSVVGDAVQWATLRVAVHVEAYALPAVLSAVFMLWSKRGQGFMYYIGAHWEHKFFSIE